EQRPPRVLVAEGRTVSESAGATASNPPRTHDINARRPKVIASVSITRPQPARSQQLGHTCGDQAAPGARGAGPDARTHTKVSASVSILRPQPARRQQLGHTCADHAASQRYAAPPPLYRTMWTVLCGSTNTRAERGQTALVGLNIRWERFGGECGT